MNQELFTPSDIEQLSERGISLEDAKSQIESIKTGFPYLNIIDAASLDFGIMRVDENEQSAYLDIWDQYLQSSYAHVCKMIPASGAASRMFKDLYNFLESPSELPEAKSVVSFFDNITKFAFYERLNEACLRTVWKTIPKLITSGKYKAIVENLLLPKGLNYGNSPKGIILFHKYYNDVRTAAEEHLAEGALYARNLSGEVNIHYTVSPEYLELFKAVLDKRKMKFEDFFGVNFDLSFSIQKASTDTLALDEDGNIFRDKDGNMLFRPGGHGALLSNVNDLRYDVIFIKNIDNVVPDSYKSSTIINKKLLGGILMQARKKIFDYLRHIDSGKVSHGDLMEMSQFLKDNFCIMFPDQKEIDDKDLLEILKAKLNRPIRVCGMVKNEGEPGGGPFIVREPDGSTSLQILESSQINTQIDSQKELLEQSTYFNPVDLVCSTVDYQGRYFDLDKFRNSKTGFVSSKSKDGKSLRALELPGLWNGAMHHWNTIFVEVPLSTFNPVKVVNDLLREEHQTIIKKQ